MRPPGCTQCEPLNKRIDRLSPSRYVELAGAARELVEDGTLTVVTGNVRLEAIRAGHSLPDDGSDGINHIFECTRCKHRFALWVDTYHGSAQWEPLKA